MQFQAEPVGECRFPHDEARFPVRVAAVAELVRPSPGMVRGRDTFLDHVGLRRTPTT